MPQYCTPHFFIVYIVKAVIVIYDSLWENKFQAWIDVFSYSNED